MAARPNAGFREIVEIRSSGSPLARNDVVASSGHQGFDIIAPNWLGLFAPAGTNSAARQELSAALAKIQGDPAFAQTMARLHAFPVSSYQASSNGLIESLRLALSLQR
jgi:tripartite-type tricarboxylate transporter receptor subunit TctC